MDKVSPAAKQDRHHEPNPNVKSMSVNIVPPLNPKMVSTSVSSSGPVQTSSSSNSSLTASPSQNFIKNSLNNPSSWKTEPKKLLSHVRMEHLVAGMSGGVASTLILHPLDLVKIRFAVSDGHHSRPKYDGLFHAFKSILKNEGVPGLYRGVTPNVWGAGSSWGLYFLFYSSLKTWMQGGDTRRDLGAVKHMTIAAEAGLLTLIVTNPLWVVKTRLCLQYGTPAAGAIATSEGGLAAIHYSGMTDALKKVWKIEGIRGLYKGFVPGMFGVSHGAIQFMTYEEMKTVYNRYRELPIDTKLSTGEYLSFAAISKLIAAGTTYPYQVVRARLQDQHRSYTGVMDVLRQTWRYEGLAGFYKGLTPYLFHVTPNICLVFLIYETFTSDR